MLCFRCEKRAVFLEEGHAPRHECKDVDKSMSGCYCYEPVKPVSLKRSEYAGEYGKINNERPVSPSIVGARMRAVEIADCTLEMDEDAGVYTMYYKPKEKEKGKK